MAPGYSPVARDPLTAAGRDACAEMTEWLGKAKAKGHLTPHDVTTGSMVAMIVTGGDVDAGAPQMPRLQRDAILAPRFIKPAKPRTTPDTLLIPNRNRQRIKLVGNPVLATAPDKFFMIERLAGAILLPLKP